MWTGKRAAKKSECFVSVSALLAAEKGSLERIVELSREHFAAKGNTSVERHRGKIGTLPLLELRPIVQRGQRARKRSSHQLEKLEITLHGADLAAVLRALGAKMKELHHARIVLAARSGCDARDFLHFHGERLLGLIFKAEAAIRDEKLQQSRQGHHEDHRG